MTLFNTNQKLGEGHHDSLGHIGLDPLMELPVSDMAVSLYLRILNTANNKVYELDFARITGSDKEWLSAIRLSTPQRLEAARDELARAGLIFQKDGGWYVKNYLLFLRHPLRTDRDEFLASIGGGLNERANIRAATGIHILQLQGRHCANES